MNQLLAALIICCAIFDSAITCWRISLHGISIERSALTRLAAEKLGPKTGTFFSIILPNLIIATVACGLGWTAVLLFYGGYRSNLAVMQFVSMRGNHG